MTHPFLRNAGRLSLYILLWGLAAMAIGSALAAALPGVSFAQGMGAGAILAITFGALALPLWDAMRYGSLTGGNPLTRLLSHFSLALIMLALWLGVGCGVGALVGPMSWTGIFLPALPFLLVTGALLYIVVTQVYAAILSGTESAAADEDETEDVAGATGAIVSAGTAASSAAGLPASSAAAGLAPGNARPAAASGKPLENIAVKTGRKIDMIPVGEILYLKSESDYVMIHTASGRFLKEQTMKQFEQSLPPEQFVRVHRSYMVNVRAISRIERYGKGEHLLILHTGATIRASEAGFRELRSRLKL